MKKFLPSFLTALFIATSSYGATLTPEQALSRITEPGMRAKISARNKPELKMTRFVDDRPVIYLFSNGADRGFIAVSADDSSIPVLGYSDEGTFTGNEKELPDGFVYWMTSLGEQIALNEGTYTPRQSAARAPIAPMVQTKWNQSAPFNNDCPTINGTRCVTGCVATAMAQAMKYYNYPTKGTGQSQYDWSYKKPNDPKTYTESLSFNYGETTFDWANMIDSYNGTYTDQQAAAVANLMYACGVSVEMSYSTGSSGAISRNMVNALVNYFGYSNSAQYCQRNYYTLDDWETLIYDNLNNYGPVLYGGQSNTGGHEFICDGYSNGYFHFNWGWGGTSDGYFVLTALNPSDQGIGGSTGGYNFSQDIIIKLSTDNTSQNALERMYLNADLTVVDQTSTLGSYFQYKTGIFNGSNFTFDSVTIGFQITSESDGSSTFMRSFSTTNLKPNYGYSPTTTLSALLPSDLAPGKYIIRPAFICPNGNNVVTLVEAPINIRSFYIMEVDGKNVTFTAPVTAELDVKDLEFVTDTYLNTLFKMTGTLTNISDSREYYNPVAIVAYDSEGNAVAAGEKMMLDLQPGETLDWEYLSTLSALSGVTVTTGKSYDFYLCKVTETYSSSLPGYITTYTKLGSPVSGVINAQPEQATLSITDLKVTTNDKVFTATATVNCSSGYFAGTLPLYIFPGVGGRSIGSSNSDFFCVGATTRAVDSSAKINYWFIFEPAESNTSYFAQILYNGKWVSNQAAFTTGTVTGIEEITEEVSDVVRTEYYTLTGTRLIERPTERGIYIVREYLIDGSVRAKRVAF